MVIIALMIGVSIYMVTLYFGELLKESKHMQRRLEKLAFGSYQTFSSSRLSKKGPALLRSQRKSLSFEQIRKIAYLFVALSVVSYVIKSPVSMPLLALSAVSVAAIFLISWKKSQKKGRIRRELPGALDLMVICLGAGLGISASFERVAREMEGSPLGEEFRQITNESNTGMPLEEALRNFSSRLNMPEVTSIVGPVIQAHKSGASISDTFVIQSESLREKLKLALKEKIMRIPVIVLLPMVVFILPVIFIFVLAPVFITMAASGA